MNILFDMIGDTPVPEITEHLNLIEENGESASERIALLTTGAVKKGCQEPSKKQSTPCNCNFYSMI